MLTIGSFDGVHLGHRGLLSRLREIADATGLAAATLTFEPQPREFFSPATAPTRLSTLREKLELLAGSGIDLACVIRFNAAFAALTAEEFIRQALVDSLRVKHLIVGDDFRFGAKHQGNFTLLEEAGRRYGFSVERLPGIAIHGERASSSAVRHALSEGRLEHAASLLGRPYTMDGRVVRGERLGQQLGFATANIHIKHRKSPLLGVFAVEVHGLPDGPHPGVANLGLRPSINLMKRPILEIHLLDFSRDIYGKHLEVRFLHKLRNETKFPDIGALKAQIARDVESARHYFTH